MNGIRRWGKVALKALAKYIPAYAEIIEKTSICLVEQDLSTNQLWVRSSKSIINDYILYVTQHNKSARNYHRDDL